MTDNPDGGAQPPANDPGASATTPEPDNSDDFTPEQKKKLGSLLAAERRKVRDQFKDYEDLKKKLQDSENAKLSDAERLQKERDEARGDASNWRTKAESLEAEKRRINLFADFKLKDGSSLPINLLKYVSGSSKEDIQSSIESLASDFGAKLEKKKSVGNPTPPGSSSTPGKHDFMNAQILSAAGRGGR